MQIVVILSDHFSVEARVKPNARWGTVPAHCRLSPPKTRHPPESQARPPIITCWLLAEMKNKLSIPFQTPDVDSMNIFLQDCSVAVEEECRK